VDWLRVLRDGLPAVIALTVLGLLAALVATSLQPTQYRSEATIVVGSSRGFLEPEWADGLSPVASTVTRLASSKAVLDGAAREYVASAPNPSVAASRRDEVDDFEWLEKHLTARQVADSGIVELAGEAETQRDARDLTRAGATSLKEKISEGPGSVPATTTRGGGDGIAGARGIVVRDFQTTDEGQVSPTPLRNLVLGGNVGLVLGIVAGLALGARRRRLRRPDEMAAELGIPILANLRAADTANGVPRSLSAARARLQRLGEADQGTVFLLTGTARPERTAQIGEALARAFASSARTVLVDADLEGQHATRNLEVDGLPGLGELLDGRATQPGLLRPEQVLVTTVEGDGEADGGDNGRLEVLPAGERPSNVAASLAAPSLGRSIQSLRLRYEFVIVIAPGLDRPEEVIPLAEVADWSVLITPRGERARTFEVARDLALTDALAGRVAGAIIVDRR
jgi:capsular polysaccharide biosynthesis protein/Mrp family chromosome partitioning ATPase